MTSKEDKKKLEKESDGLLGMLKGIGGSILAGYAIDKVLDMIEPKTPSKIQAPIPPEEPDAQSHFSEMMDKADEFKKSMPRAETPSVDVNSVSESQPNTSGIKLEEESIKGLADYTGNKIDSLSDAISNAAKSDRAVLSAVSDVGTTLASNDQKVLDTMASLNDQGIEQAAYTTNTLAERLDYSTETMLGSFGEMKSALGGGSDGFKGLKGIVASIGTGLQKHLIPILKMKWLQDAKDKAKETAYKAGKIIGYASEFIKLIGNLFTNFGTDTFGELGKKILDKVTEVGPIVWGYIKDKSSELSELIGKTLSSTEFGIEIKAGIKNIIKGIASTLKEDNPMRQRLEDYAENIKLAYDEKQFALVNKILNKDSADASAHDFDENSYKDKGGAGYGVEIQYIRDFYRLSSDEKISRYEGVSLPAAELMFWNIRDKDGKPVLSNNAIKQGGKELRETLVKSKELGPYFEALKDLVSKSRYKKTLEQYIVLRRAKHLSMEEAIISIFTEKFTKDNVTSYLVTVDAYFSEILTRLLQDEKNKDALNKFNESITELANAQVTPDSNGNVSVGDYDSTKYLNQNIVANVAMNLEKSGKGNTSTSTISKAFKGNIQISDATTGLVFDVIPIDQDANALMNAFFMPTNEEIEKQLAKSSKWVTIAIVAVIVGGVVAAVFTGGSSLFAAVGSIAAATSTLATIGTVGTIAIASAQVVSIAGVAAILSAGLSKFGKVIKQVYRQFNWQVTDYIGALLKSIGEYVREVEPNSVKGSYKVRANDGKLIEDSDYEYYKKLDCSDISDDKELVARVADKINKLDLPLVDPNSNNSILRTFTTGGKDTNIYNVLINLYLDKTASTSHTLEKQTLISGITNWLAGGSNTEAAQKRANTGDGKNSESRTIKIARLYKANAAVMSTAAMTDHYGMKSFTGNASDLAYVAKSLSSAEAHDLDSKEAYININSIDQYNPEFSGINKEQEAKMQDQYNTLRGTATRSAEAKVDQKQHTNRVKSIKGKALGKYNTTDQLKFIREVFSNDINLASSNMTEQEVNSISEDCINELLDLTKKLSTDKANGNEASEIALSEIKTNIIPRYYAPLYASVITPLGLGYTCNRTSKKLELVNNGYIDKHLTKFGLKKITIRDNKYIKNASDYVSVRDSKDSMYPGTVTISATLPRTSKDGNILALTNELSNMLGGNIDIEIIRYKIHAISIIAKFYSMIGSALSTDDFNLNQTLIDKLDYNFNEEFARKVTELHEDKDISGSNEQALLSLISDDISKGNVRSISINKSGNVIYNGDNTGIDISNFSKAGKNILSRAMEASHQEDIVNDKINFNQDYVKYGYKSYEEMKASYDKKSSETESNVTLNDREKELLDKIEKLIETKLPRMVTSASMAGSTAGSSAVNTIQSYDNNPVNIESTGKKLTGYKTNL